MSNHALALAEIIENSLPEGWQARTGVNPFDDHSARLTHTRDKTQPGILITINPRRNIAISTHNGLLSASFPQDANPDHISAAVVSIPRAGFWGFRPRDPLLAVGFRLCFNPSGGILGV